MVDMWLMYYKRNLRAVGNSILDDSAYVLGISAAAAKDLMINQAFQTEADTNRTWQRAIYPSTVDVLFYCLS